jgi:hypothetical protein
MKLLAVLRGSDGRSLAIALACLLVVSSLIGGVQAGVAASPATGVLCTLGATGGGAPPADHPEPCCMAGCLSPAPVLAATPAALSAPANRSVDVLRPLAGSISPDLPQLIFGPRGPPSLA